MINQKSLPCSCHVLLLILLSSMVISAFGYGSLGPIAAAFGENGFFCAIDAGGKQEIICWEKNNNKSSSSSLAYVSTLPAMVALSGGEEFLCGITWNRSEPYCWTLSSSGTYLLQPSSKYSSYSKIAAGKNHVCAIRGSYYSDVDYGNVDCWEFSESSNNVLVYNSSFFDSSVGEAVFKDIVSGDGFSCGVLKDGGVVCWGPKSGKLGVSGSVKSLASGRGSVCGISSKSGELFCWGDSKEFGDFPVGIRFVALSAGAHHFCGIREDDHGIECWGSIKSSTIPKDYGFTAIASSDFTSCGVREADLVLDCWDVQGESPPNYSPPLQLCSPGICSPSSCGDGKFSFNVSILNEAELANVCVQPDLKICLPCGSNCSKGFFPSSKCSKNVDRICSACSLCQSKSCWDVCGVSSSSKNQPKEERNIKMLVIIVGSCVLLLVLILIGCCVIPLLFVSSNEERDKTQCLSCFRKQSVEAEPSLDHEISISATATIGTAQVFRLSELKDATNGFKEFNELGRGSYGFVYKATLADGTQVAVKRANAATIIRTNGREFEAELDVLCNIRHDHIVNLLGYCSEMGERLLVYELMPHGTLDDHLHGELSPLNWNLRLKISLQAAEGLEYLHKVACPPIVHHNLKASNILLDSNWDARVSDFGLLSVNDMDSAGSMETDVYNFGIVLLEILSGRKAYDSEYAPPDIVEWALPLIRRGRAAAIFDRNAALPRNVEPLLKLADVAELALKENPNERAGITDIVLWLDQIGLTL
ncbi:serine/threonine-protein kinase-like protein CCR1 [Heracleum sosnowskyi]|uniref:non-specific serine/threonine protein kinase n=1 Tax=Heracleum sosnowskyi TaxID=360622 RepID=A0AAD8J563_9APIA|nr:serine/threonine-protein kinase-like protein CCR1 [Heracleum sosnowskyi]